MIKPPPFPIEPSGVDAELLSEALGVDVVDVSLERIGADRGMLGEIFLAHLTYATPNGHPPRVVVKMAADREQSLATARRARTNERELRCYDELLAVTPVRAPQFYAAWYDPETARYLMVQEAIEADTTVDQLVGIGPERVHATLIEVAKLHAHWWDSPVLTTHEWLLRPDSPGRMQNLTGFAANGWAAMCALLPDEFSLEEQALGRDFPARLGAALTSLGSQARTLIHSDLRADNVLFSLDGKSATIIDWQGVGVGPPALDLAYLLSQSLTVADRRAHEDELLRAYWHEMRGLGVNVSFDKALFGYGESMLYCLSIACALQIVSDPNEPRVRDLTRVIARRSLEAMRDHGQMW